MNGCMAFIAKKKPWSKLLVTVLLILSAGGCKGLESYRTKSQDCRFAGCEACNTHSYRAACETTGDGAQGWLWTDPECGHSHPYTPREGDLVMMTSRSCSYTFAYTISGAGHPLHIGMVVRNACGELRLLESGMLEGKRVTMRPVISRICEYLADSKDGLIWIRQTCEPLSEHQSQALTAFAESQCGKEFAQIRASMFILPFDAKLTTTPNQERWFCSELVVQALKQMGMVCPNVRPANILPDDIYHNRRVDLSPYYLASQQWTPKQCIPSERPLLAPVRPD